MSHAALVLVAALAILPGPAQPQGQAKSAPRASRLGHGPDSIPDLTNHFVVVYGLRPLNDSAIIVLQRRGYRVADRSPGAIERARAEHRRLDPAKYAVLVEVQYDSLARGPILKASLLDIETTSRLRMVSVMFPRDIPWGPAMETVLRLLLARPENH